MHAQEPLDLVVFPRRLSPMAMAGNYVVRTTESGGRSICTARCGVVGPMQVHLRRSADAYDVTLCLVGTNTRLCSVQSSSYPSVDGRNDVSSSSTWPAHSSYSRSSTWISGPSWPADFISVTAISTRAVHQIPRTDWTASWF